LSLIIALLLQNMLDEKRFSTSLQSASTVIEGGLDSPPLQRQYTRQLSISFPLLRIPDLLATR